MAPERQPHRDGRVDRNQLISDIRVIRSGHPYRPDDERLSDSPQGRQNSMIIINGVPDDGQWHYSKRHRPRKRDEGHSIVQTAQKVGMGLHLRRLVVCECGKTYTGWGDRAFRSHQQHLEN